MTSITPLHRAQCSFLYTSPVVRSVTGGNEELEFTHLLSDARSDTRLGQDVIIKNASFSETTEISGLTNLEKHSNFTPSSRDRVVDSSCDPVAGQQQS